MSLRRHRPGRIKRRRRPKSACQLQHAFRRGAQRYGVFLSEESFAELVDQIQTGRGEFVERQSKRVSKWQVQYDGTPMTVIYDKKRKTIVTVLPPKEGAHAQS